MNEKPSYEELEQRVKELERKAGTSFQHEFRGQENIFQAIGQPAYILNLNHEILAVNNATIKIFGKSEKNFIGKKCYEIFHDTDQQPDNCPLTKTLISDQIETGEMEVQAFDRFLLVSCAPVFGDSGEISSFLHIATDITERKRAEEALRESEEKYHNLYSLLRLLTDNVPDMIWAKDLDGKYLFANKAICEGLINAKDTDEPIGKTDVYFAKRERTAHPENPHWHDFGEMCNDSDSLVLESKNIERFDEFGNVKGQFLYLDVHKAPFWDKHAEIIGTVGCGRDVTNEKKVTKALKEKEIELERKNLRLEELNSALNILLKKRDEDKKVLEEKVLMSIKELIIPYVVKLKETTLNDRQGVFLEIIQSNLEDIISPFAHKMSYKYLNFTPMEIQVADLVKQGLRTKEIAGLLNSSPETVAGHRKSIRKKLNLKDKKSNLRTYLLSLNNGR